MNALMDFLYLDIDRVKSLLSQMKGGVVESVIEKFRDGNEGRAGAKVFGIGELGGSLVREKSTEQTKSLRDYLYTIFERAAEEANLFLKHDFAKLETWTGDTRSKLRGGQLVRVTALTRILDAAYFKKRIDNTLELPKEIAAFTTMSQQVGWSDDFRKLNLQVLGDEMLGGKHVAENMLAMGRFVDTYFSGQIVLRQFPRGLDDVDCNFVGLLADKSGFLQEDRDTLFTKYGHEVSAWTVVAQIASVPNESKTSTESAAPPNILDPGGKAVSRHRFEQLANALMSLMQAQGFVGAPAFPEVSITPIAVYHKVKY